LKTATPFIEKPKPFIIPVFLPHAGCPHRCVFCNQRAITGKGADPPSAPALRAQVASFLAYKGRLRQGVQIAFYGGNFLGLPPPALETLLKAAAALIQAGKADAIRFSTRPDTITKERLLRLRDLPIAAVELGVQSMNDRVLALSKRGHTSRQVDKAVAFLKAENHEIGLQLMVGLPGDDEIRAVRSAEKAAALCPDFVRIYPTLVLKDSPLARLYREGRYVPLSLAAAVSQTGKMYRIFAVHGIAVIRMGLQASKELESEAVIAAGPYHPAFGELVYAEVFLDRVRALMKKAQLSTAVTLQVHPRNRSRLQGLRSGNIAILKKEFGLQSISICTDPSLAADEVKLRP